MMWRVNTDAIFQVDVGSESAGAATVDVTRANGTSIASGAVAVDNADGTYSYTLSSTVNDQLDRIRLDWHFGTQTLTTFEEIVGNHLFTVEQARNRESSGQQTPLSDTDDYPDSQILRKRTELTEAFEENTGRSWIRRYCRVETSGSGTRVLRLNGGIPRDSVGNRIGGAGKFRDGARVISATIGGTSVTTTDLEISGGYVYHKAGTWTRGTVTDPLNVVVEYAYGLDPVPYEATDHALRELVANLVRGDLSRYVQTSTTSEQTISYPQGGFTWTPQTKEWFKSQPRIAVA